MSAPVTNVLWFRRDLRLADHPALWAAIDAGDAVAPLFVLDERLLAGRFASPRRNAFLLASLEALAAELARLGNTLRVERGPAEKAVLAFARERQARAVFASRDYTPYARSRDAAVARALAECNIEFHTKPGTLILEPEQVLKRDDSPFSVFTAFRRACGEVERRPVLPAPPTIPSLRAHGAERPGAPLPSHAQPVIPAGEAAATKRLGRFLAAPITEYASRRDRLDLAGTSGLSADLRIGLLSPLEILERSPGEGEGPAKFVDELAWRDFFAHVLWHHPRVAREPYRRQLGTLSWHEDASAFAAWSEGRTGYPVVDAGMRQLQASGSIHNRGRMIVASFLAKDLFLDWRLGERWFMQQLIDGDPASNNGGWQWAASLGSDAQPYFRIFNPLIQGQRFDPLGDYVRRWLPELRHVPLRYIHCPWTMPDHLQRQSGCTIGVDYPPPIVDHALARRRALAWYASAQAKRPPH